MATLLSPVAPAAGNGPSEKPEPSKKTPPAKINNEKFEIQEKLGAGCFGEVYRGVNTETGTEVAVKTEDAYMRNPQLQSEADMLRFLGKPTAQQGFVECFFYGRERGFNCLVMELLGKSLDDMVKKCSGQFTAKTTVLVAEQVLQRIEYLHSKGIIHRDIKPENFMFGTKGTVHHVYLIDFGLSNKYFDGKHSAMRTGLTLTGTARYASINAHKGRSQSRRDDLEAIGYMLLFFLRGSMPWSGIQAKNQEDKFRKIMKMKENFPLEELCSWGDWNSHPFEENEVVKFLPAFEEYMRYTRKLGFAQRPDYNMLLGKFRACRCALKIKEDHEFQWFDPLRPEYNPPPGPLLPLATHAEVAQPDDSKNVGKSRRGLCFCGGSATKD